jgi:Secretion system C-terminal sorting domain
MKKIAALGLLLVIIVTPAGRLFSQSSAGALQPVLVSFNASLSNDREVRFTWTVQQQFVTDIFDIEKSTDGQHWTIKSTGISSKPVSYTASDDMPIKGSNLYRLRISSMDGSCIYTVVKNVSVGIPVATRLYPNPSVNLVTVSLAQRPEAGYWYLLLINTMGRVVAQKKYHNSETKICLPVGNYPNGNYILQISDGNARQQTTLMINHH